MPYAMASRPSMTDPRGVFLSKPRRPSRTFLLVAPLYFRERRESRMGWMTAGTEADCATCVDISR